MAQKEKCSFSISLNKEKNIKHMTIGNESNSKVLIEGDIGTIDKIKVVDDVLLEIKGINGVIDISLPKNILEKLKVKQETVR
ncbi:MAG: hypothetical protein KAV87_04500 [Desulfobacteraceae bacterium]|nr:hypothetical protein [Desulfobacteraceae bacterium]